MHDPYSSPAYSSPGCGAAEIIRLFCAAEIRLCPNGNAFQPGEAQSACAAWQTLAAEGAAGLYRGFAAVLAGVLPANALYYGTYELLRGVLPGAAGGAAVGAAAQVSPNP